ncbi:hypothetical protein RJ639_046784 [Escallonia herrerae]|uniref:Uncharacterized protein n=1 Tax=Escallonia herrerae TaxID=1293975 RepID=A0AA88W9D7_9ASTE|nr:hypothetical protein RJ639_046784 [Escallonia herrerae]
MEKNGKVVDGEKIGGKNKVVSGLGTPKVVLNGKIEEDDDDELKSLLSPPPRGGLLKKPGNPRRKHGLMAFTVVGLNSDVSDSDDEDSDACMCTVM